MQNFDLSKINTSGILSARNVHFIGIGGIGISAVARMMKEEGKNVTGQDMQEGEIVNELRNLGIDIKIGQSYDNIPLDTELIVYTIAIEYYDSELFQKIKSLESSKVGPSKMVVKSYPEMLGVISESKYTIAVCGTHGKTTTTGMISEILIDAGKKPTVIVGSLLKDPSSVSGRANFIKGGPNQIDGRDYFVVEACEYRRSFLNISPKVLVITNVDEDHLDYYKDIEDIKSAFHEMMMKVPEDGFIICDPNDKNMSDVIKGAKGKIVNYTEYFDKDIKLMIPGVHNKKDAAAATAAAATLGISKESSKKYLEKFPGTWKRFEFRGKLSNGSLLYDDYAHHPAEIISTLLGFREIYPKEDEWKIFVIFQPHLFSRTKLLLNDFAKSFYDVDQVLILPIYYAREVDDGSISSVILAEEINKKSNNAKAFPDFESLENYISSSLGKMNEKCIIVTMGAGNASKVGDYLLANFK